MKLKLLLISLRQSLTLKKIEVGPAEAAGKDVAGVVKSLDDKLMSVGVIVEKVKAKCKGCPNVSNYVFICCCHHFISFYVIPYDFLAHKKETFCCRRSFPKNSLFVFPGSKKVIDFGLGK